MQLETDEHWYTLFGFFYSQQSDEQKLEIIQPWNKDSLLVEIFNVLKTGRVDTLKVNMLVFIEENINFFFGSHPTTLQGACTLMNELLTLPSGTSTGQPHTSLYVKCQVLTTLTSILICSDIIHTQPSAIEAFIELLLDIISKTNTAVDRNLRQTACECLRELSHHYTGLLSHRLGQLMYLVQDEKTHAHQSYLGLFSTVLVSTIDAMQKIISTNLKNNANIMNLSDTDVESLERDLGDLLGTKFKSSHSGSLNFKIFRKSLNNHYRMPPNILKNSKPWRMCITVPKRPHAFMTFLRSQIRNVLRTLVEALPLMVSIEALRTSMDIVFLISNVTIYSLDGKMSDGEDIPLNVESLISVLKPFLRKHSLLLWNAVLVILNGLPYHQVTEINNSLRPQFDENVLNLLKSHHDDIIDEYRYICIEWIANQLPRYKSGQVTSLASILYPSRHKYYPTQFDNLRKVHAKLFSLPYFYEKKSGSKLIPPDNLTNLFTYLDDFVLYNSGHPKVELVFSILKYYLKIFPTQFDHIFNYVSRSLERQPLITSNVLNILRQSGNIKEDIDRSTQDTFLIKLAEFLTNLTPPLLFNYMDLLKSIITYTFLNINKIIKSIFLNLRCCTSTTSGDWLFGDQILDIVNTIICIYPTSIVQVHLREILSFLSENFAEVEIRNRAQMYLRLLTHIPGERIRKVLSDDPLESIGDADMAVEGESVDGDVAKNLSTPLVIERLHPQFNYNSLLILKDNPLIGEKFDDESVCLESYLQFLDFTESNGTKSNDLFNIKLPYLLKYKNTDSNKDQVFYSLKLTVEGSQINLNQSFTVEIPIISSDGNEGTEYGEKIFDTIEGKFPSSYSFLIDLMIPIPIPTTFNVKLTFNSDDGDVKTVLLDNLNLTVRDLMLPVPHISLHYKQGYDRVTYVSKIFNEFWNYRKLEDGDNLGMTDSVKAIDISKEDSLKVILNNLSPYLVDPESFDDKELNPTLSVMAFLPRKYHLLMKISILDKTTIIHIKTDFWRILSFLDKYLDELFRTV